MRFRSNRPLRPRRILFLPPALFATSLLLLLTSELISALDSKLVALPADSTGFEIVRYETECESLRRQIEEIASDLRLCEALPGCLHSENLCPDVMVAELTHEYEEVRASALARCSDVSTTVTPVAAACATPVSVSVDCEGQACEDPTLGRAPGFSEGTPEIYVF